MNIFILTKNNYLSFMKKIIFSVIFIFSIIYFPTKSFAYVDDWYYSGGEVRTSYGMICNSGTIWRNSPMVQVKINGTWYPRSMSEMSQYSGATSTVTDKFWSFEIPYDGFSIMVYGQFEMAKQTVRLRAGDDLYIQVEFPHGSNANVGNGDIQFRYYSGSRYVTENGYNVKSKLDHVRSCSGGSWETTDTRHRKYCQTCKYTSVSWADHTWKTKTRPTCSKEGTEYCTTCGKTRSIAKEPHSYAGFWSNNETQHWHQCANCGNKKDVANHNFVLRMDSTYHAYQCTVCNYTKNKEKHNFVKKYDDTTHWDQCSGCGLMSTKNSHTWTYSNINAKTHDKKCNACGKIVKNEAHNFINNKCACGRYNTVTVSFDLNNPNPPGGLLVGPVPSSVNQITYTYGDKYYDSKYGLVNPTLQDYTFEGWYTAKTGGTKVNTGTAVSNSNAHTLYAHWKKKALPITKIELTKNPKVIEYLNGITETQYQNKYNRGNKLACPYANINLPSNITKPKGTYIYKWEYYKDGKWQNVNLSGVSVSDTALDFKNVTRDLNNVKFRLTVKGNHEDVVRSNEATLTVWWLPNASEQIYTIIGD